MITLTVNYVFLFNCVVLLFNPYHVNNLHSISLLAGALTSMYSFGPIAGLMLAALCLSLPENLTGGKSCTSHLLNTSFPCRYRQKTDYAGPWERKTLTRRREPVSLVTRTRRLMKQPTAQHGGARNKRDRRAWHHSCSVD